MFAVIIVDDKGETAVVNVDDTVVDVCGLTKMACRTHTQEDQTNPGKSCNILPIVGQHSLDPLEGGYRPSTRSVDGGGPHELRAKAQNPGASSTSLPVELSALAAEVERKSAALFGPQGMCDPPRMKAARTTFLLSRRPRRCLAVARDLGQSTQEQSWELGVLLNSMDQL
ncbi:hypothetical protein NDU88_001444 [Pleurodeles waltl]|uniref:Uncharacterized protein n=1 Tax=Pleurodeles waltl TaxID=8319 RepID=A0AAV7L9K4_PLEWA|nr:hypothetical protein NDU88_001444 [Pleurodeles waltl]